MDAEPPTRSISKESIQYGPVTENPVIGFGAPSLSEFMNSPKRKCSTNAMASKKKRKTTDAFSSAVVTHTVDMPSMVASMVEVVQVYFNNSSAFIWLILNY